MAKGVHRSEKFGPMEPSPICLSRDADALPFEDPFQPMPRQAAQHWSLLRSQSDSFATLCGTDTSGAKNAKVAWLVAIWYCCDQRRFFQYSEYLLGLHGMSMEGSISLLIHSFRDGDDVALAALHTRYWPVMVAIARKELHGAPPRAADEEDVAQQAFWSFYRSVRAGQLPKLANRHDLLAILTHITVCRAKNQLQHEFGTGRKHIQGESALDAFAGRSSISPGLQQRAVFLTTPDDEAMLRDGYAYYMSQLPEQLRELARLHLAGDSNREIAEELDCSERTVERKLALLRLEWERLAAESTA